MRVLTLRRSDMGPLGTLGQIVDEKGKRIVDTLELPWLGNKRDVSCIPASSYTARRFLSPTHGYELFKLDGVPGRDDVELHIGNYSTPNPATKKPDTKGCILLGLGWIWLDNGAPMLTASKTGFALFMNLLSGVDSFTLAIVDPQPLAA